MSKERRSKSTGAKLSYLATDKQKEIYTYFEEHGIAATQSKYKLSRARIYQIKKLIENPDAAQSKMGSLFGLSIKTCNALRRAGIENAETLEAFYAAEGAAGLKKIRNIGNRNIEEIVDFLAKTEIDRREELCSD